MVDERLEWSQTIGRFAPHLYHLHLHPHSPQIFYLTASGTSLSAAPLLCFLAERERDQKKPNFPLCHVARNSRRCWMVNVSTPFSPSTPLLHLWSVKSNIPSLFRLHTSEKPHANASNSQAPCDTTSSPSDWGVGIRVTNKLSDVLLLTPWPALSYCENTAGAANGEEKTWRHRQLLLPLSFLRSWPLIFPWFIKHGHRWVSEWVVRGSPRKKQHKHKWKQTNNEQYRRRKRPNL